MTIHLKTLISPLRDPYKNLALENYLLLNIKPGEKVLLFYINEPCIVYGRFQNPWLECDLLQAKERGVHLVRRQSGGGTVYHDEGNLNFSFIEAKRDFDKEENNQCIIDALKCFDIKSEASKRSDLITHFEGVKKFSGSAFKQKKDRSFHHGTLLVNAKLDKLNGMLRSKHEILESKSIDSVRSNVINLSELSTTITIENTPAAIIKSFEDRLGLKAENIDFNESLIDQEYLSSLTSYEWILNETPKFKIKLGGVVFEFNKGKLLSVDGKDDFTLNDNMKDLLKENHL